MAVGWAGDGAVQEQIEAGVEDEIKRARSRLPRGKSRTHCRECAQPIPKARQTAVPGVQLCIACQAEQEEAQPVFTGFNRRGSKDSQLK